MPDYNVFCLDDDGNIAKKVSIACGTDLKALRHAYDFCADYSVELWNGQRQICVIAKGSTPPPNLGNGLLIPEWPSL